MLENGGFLIVLTYPDSEKGFCFKAACVLAEQNLIRMFGVMDGSDTSAADIAESEYMYVTTFVQIFVDQENTIYIYIYIYWITYMRLQYTRLLRIIIWFNNFHGL